MTCIPSQVILPHLEDDLGGKTIVTCVPAPGCAVTSVPGSIPVPVVTTTGTPYPYVPVPVTVPVAVTTAGVPPFVPGSGQASTPWGGWQGQPWTPYPSVGSFPWYPQQFPASSFASAPWSMGPSGAAVSAGPVQSGTGDGRFPMVPPGFEVVAGADTRSAVVTVSEPVTTRPADPVNPYSVWTATAPLSSAPIPVPAAPSLRSSVIGAAGAVTDQYQLITPPPSTRTNSVKPFNHFGLGSNEVAGIGYYDLIFYILSSISLVSVTI